MVDDPVVLCLSSRNSIVFYKFLGPRKSRAAFFFYPSIEFGLLRQLTEIHLEVRISRELVPPHVAVHVGQQASVQFSFFLFTTVAGMKSSNPCQNRSIHYVPAHATPDAFFRVFTLRRNSHFPCTTSKLFFFCVQTDFQP